MHGMLAQGLTLGAVATALRDRAGASPLVAVLGLAMLAAYEGARFGLVAFGAAWTTKRGWPFVVTFPLMLALSERIYPMFFPWSTALLLQTVPVLVQSADFGGTMAISLWVGFTNAALIAGWRCRKEAHCFVRHGVAALATVAVVVIYGVFSMNTVDEVTASAPAFKIGLVQGNVERKDDGTVDPLALYRQASRDLLRNNNVDLLVWPETATARIVRDDMLPSFLSSQVFAPIVSGDGGAISSPILAGLILEQSVERHSSEFTASAPRRFNSVVLASPPGRVLGLYDKRSLVPFGEYLPYEQNLPWLRKLLPSAGAFSAGSGARVLALNEHLRILPLICFEDILADRVRLDVQQTDPDLLVNVTSDAWFGDSRLADLHFAIARLRAVEHRRFVVRVTNTGITAVIDAAGRAKLRLPAHATVAVTAMVRAMRDPTLYGALGGWLENLLLAAVLATMVLPLRTTRAARIAVD
jgi:apolipoprotein N-acyltransferase